MRGTNRGVAMGGRALRQSTGRNDEFAHHAAIVEYARVLAASADPRYAPLAFLFHAANGGLRAKATAGQMRALGVLPGVPDLLLCLGKGARAGLAIEVKSPRERGRGLKALSPEQQRWLALHQALGGWSTHVVFHADGGRAVVKWYAESARSETLDAYGAEFQVAHEAWELLRLFPEPFITITGAPMTVIHPVPSVHAWWRA